MTDNICTKTVTFLVCFLFCFPLSVFGFSFLHIFFVFNFSSFLCTYSFVYFCALQVLYDRVYTWYLYKLMKHLRKFIAVTELDYSGFPYSNANTNIHFFSSFIAYEINTVFCFFFFNFFCLQFYSSIFDLLLCRFLI